MLRSIFKSFYVEPPLSLVSKSGGLKKINFAPFFPLNQLNEKGGLLTLVENDGEL